MDHGLHTMVLHYSLIYLHGIDVLCKAVKGKKVREGFEITFEFGIRVARPILTAVNERANEQTNERANKQTSKQTSERANEQANEQTGEQANEQTSKRANKQTSNQANERTSE